MLEISVLWLVNNDKELLLQQRSLSKKFHPGEWGPSVTGTAEAGEMPDVTLVREVQEELGLKPDEYVSKYIDTIDFDHEDGRTRRFSIYYALVEKNINEKFTIDTNEVGELRWMSIDEIKHVLANGSSELKLVPSSKVVWPKTFEVLENKLS